MRTFGRNLALFAFLILPAYGQIAPAPVPKAAVTDSTAAAIPATPSPAMPALETPAPALPIAETPEPSLGFPIFRTFGGLGVVLCLMIGGYFAAKKFAPSYFSKGITDRNLKVIETLSMGDKRSISMVEVGNSRYLVGNTPHQINILATLSEGLSIVSEPEKLTIASKDMITNEASQPFRNLFESEKKRPAQYAGNPLPDHIRMKMRQLRASLER
jgi:flagellar biosynthetic protein FliO